MGVNLKIRFHGTKKDLQPYWVPVVFELRPEGPGKPLRFAVEDLDQDVQDEKDKRMSFFKIPNLPAGRYTLSLLEFHTGHPITQGKPVELTGEDVEYGLVDDYRTLRQPNTYGMDLVADAPFRIEKSHPYLPVVVYIKDVEPGGIKVRSIEFYNCPSAETFQNEPLPPEAIYRVLDADGKPIEREGGPALLKLDPGEEYETVTTDPWYRIILLRKDQLQVMQGDILGYKNARYLQYMVNVRYRKTFSDSKQFVFRTRLPDGDLPRVADWYYGDTHYHSEYTRNPYEYGGPLFMTAEVVRALGLSWVTVTDHSYCLGHPRTPAEEVQGNRWQSYQQAVKKTNEKYEDILLVGAEEITTRSHFFGLHLLSFGNPFVEDKHVAGFGSLTMEEVFKKVLENSNTDKGFIYAAHPASSGYVWEEEDYRVAADPRYSQIFLGLQLFNEKILYQQTTQSMDQDFLNPFSMLDESDRKSNWAEELEEGVRKHWVERFLLPSLREYERKKVLRKFLILGGSDAHMDYNYAFRPHFAFLIHHLYDNAFGKVRTLAYLPKANGKALTEANLYRALRNGNTLATDGPVALFSLRPAGSEKTYRLGETVPLPPGKALELTLEWKSTPEFGPVQRINLYLGTARGETDISNRISLPFPGKEGYGLEGSIKQVFSSWPETPCYLRLEAASGIDPETGEALFRCITNPIWITHS